MAEDFEIRGEEIVARNLKIINDRMLKNVVEVLEWGQNEVVKDAQGQGGNHPGKGTPARGGDNRVKDPTTGTPVYADQFGNLTQSIKAGRVVKKPGGDIDASVQAGGSTVSQHGIHIEFGTEKTPPFPFFRPAILRKKDAIIKEMGKKVLKGRIF